MGKYAYQRRFRAAPLTVAHRGGVRGIVELEILRAIELEFGGQVNIQHFFDLIVGTRYENHCFGHTCLRVD